MLKCLFLYMQNKSKITFEIFFFFCRCRNYRENCDLYQLSLTDVTAFIYNLFVICSWNTEKRNSQMYVCVCVFVKCSCKASKGCDSVTSGPLLHSCETPKHSFKESPSSNVELQVCIDLLLLFAVWGVKRGLWEPERPGGKTLLLWRDASPLGDWAAFPDDGDGPKQSLLERR